MRVNNNIGYLLNHLAFMLSRRSDEILQERLGIGFSQFKIMMVLKWNPSIQQKQIADRLGQTEASVSRQIKLLYDKSLLTSRVSPNNKREHITTLTAKGEKLTEQAMQLLNNYHSPIFTTLSESEQEALISILGKMHDVICLDKDGSINHP